MLTGLKVSSWACKCVFYVPEQSPKRENAGLQLQNEIYQWIELKE